MLAFCGITVITYLYLPLNDVVQVFCGRAHHVLSGMAKLHVELACVDFPHRWGFGCLLLFILVRHAFRMNVCLPFQFLLLGVQKSVIIHSLVELGGQNKSFAVIICYFLVKNISVELFLSIRVSPSDVT